MKVLNNPSELKPWWLVAVTVCTNCATAYQLEENDPVEFPALPFGHVRPQMITVCPGCNLRGVTAWPLATSRVDEAIDQEADDECEDYDAEWNKQEEEYANRFN